MNTRLLSALLPLTLAAAAAAQSPPPDLLLTFSQPEQSLSGSGGTVLRILRTNEIHELNASTACPNSTEKWLPRTAADTMAGDENGDGILYNPALFGRIDAVMATFNSAGVGGS